MAALLLLAAERWQPWLAWIVLSPFALASRKRAGKGASFLAGAAAGSAFALVAALAGEAPWLGEVGRTYFGLSPGAAVASAAALAIACALFWGSLLGVFLWRAAALPGPFIFGGAAVWATWENLLVISFPYYPWVSLAATQSETTTVLQAASLAGQAGLSFLLAATGLALGSAASARGMQRRLVWLATGVAIALATAVLGDLRLRAAASDGRAIGARGGADTSREGCTITAVDAAIPAPGLAGDEALARYRGSSERAHSLRPDVIVWPESALERDPHLDADLRGRLQSWAGSWGAALVVGAPRLGWDADWRQLQFNSLAVIEPGAPLVAYDKRAPVPFAESWPLAAIPRPAWLAATEVSPGDRAGRLDAAGCALGVLICFEADRPVLARELAALGAQLVVVATNDAELPGEAVRVQIAEARLRAVETGLPVLRAANGGGSVAIDRYGRTTGVTRDGVLALTVGPRSLAPAVDWGGSATVAMAIVALLSVLPTPRRPGS